MLSPAWESHHTGRAARRPILGRSIPPQIFCQQWHLHNVKYSQSARLLTQQMFLYMTRDEWTHGGLISYLVFNDTFSTNRLHRATGVWNDIMWSGDRKDMQSIESCVLVCWWWSFDWSFAFCMSYSSSCHHHLNHA